MESRPATNTDVLARLDGAHVRACRAERDLLRAILECDRNELWRNQGARDHAEFLAGRYGVSKWKARRFIGAAYALEHLPLTSHALETGTLSLDKVVELTRFATPAIEKKLISWARRVTPGTVRARADAATRRSLAQVEQSESERYLRWWWHLDGSGLALEGRLPPTEGATFIAALDRLASQLPEGPDEEPEACTIDERRADALALMCSARIADDQDPDRACVVIHAPYRALTEAGPNGVIAGGPAIHHRTVQRLCCDGRLGVCLYDNDGDEVGIGRAAREPPPWLRRQVLRRDSHTCTFPGCDMRRFLHTHHIKWWEFDGRTNLKNLITVCSLHHKLVHEHGWSVGLEGRSPVWIRPGGRRFEQGPETTGAVPRQPEPAESSDDLPWPALWHALNGGDSALSDPSLVRILTWGAKWIDFGRLGHGDMQLMRARDDGKGVVLADDSSNVRRRLRTSPSPSARRSRRGSPTTRMR